jgi:hypothetical protein
VAGKGSADSGGSTRRLVIVESPAKAKTIKGYLGAGYTVEASVGHIRDLPAGADEVPEKYKGTSMGRLGVDVDGDFEPLYLVNADKRKQVAKLKDLLKEADELLLATDEDREGEAIAWHLQEVLKPKVPSKRMVFHEITREAIQEAARNTREINLQLVDAQETRRILDRLYGYEVSPVLWKKVRTGLSAGRVQSVATRMVVERERERMAFTAAEYWDVREPLTPFPEFLDEGAQPDVVGPGREPRPEVGDDVLAVADQVLGQEALGGLRIAEVLPGDVAPLGRIPARIPHQGGLHRVPGQHVASVADHQRGGVVQLVQQVQDAGAHVLGRHRGVVFGHHAGQVEQVVVLVPVQAQRPGQRAEHLGRGLRPPRLLQPDVVVH